MTLIYNSRISVVMGINLPQSLSYLSVPLTQDVDWTGSTGRTQYVQVTGRQELSLPYTESETTLSFTLFVHRDEGRKVDLREEKFSRLGKHYSQGRIKSER